MCLNPKDIPPDDLDDVILGRIVKEAEITSDQIKEAQKLAREWMEEHGKE